MLFICIFFNVNPKNCQPSPRIRVDKTGFVTLESPVCMPDNFQMTNTLKNHAVIVMEESHLEKLPPLMEAIVV